MKKIFTIAALFLLSAGMFAQDVNKATESLEVRWRSWSECSCHWSRELGCRR